MAGNQAGEIFVKYGADLTEYEAAARRAGLIAEQTSKKIQDEHKKASSTDARVDAASARIDAAMRQKYGAAYDRNTQPLDVAEAERRQAAQATARGGGAGGGAVSGGSGSGAFGRDVSFAGLAGVIGSLAGFIATLDRLRTATQDSSAEVSQFQKSLYLLNPSEQSSEYQSRVNKARQRAAEYAEKEEYYRQQYKRADDAVQQSPGDSIGARILRGYYNLRARRSEEGAIRSMEDSEAYANAYARSPGAAVAARNRQMEGSRFALERARAIQESQLTDFTAYDQIFNAGVSGEVSRVMRAQLSNLRSISEKQQMPQQVAP